MENRHSGRIWAGLLLIIGGLLLFAYKMGAPLPDWLFSWPMILIGIGLVVGFKHKFRNAGWLIMIGIGSIFLLDEQIPDFNIRNYMAPIIIILVGIVFVFRPRHPKNKEYKEYWDWKKDRKDETNAGPTEYPLGDTDNSEYLNCIAAFGGVKKVILSKNFKGGESTCFMGGAEINLIQADIHGHVILDVTQVFGGTKIVVPANWDVKSEVIAVFGGVDDKRNSSAASLSPDKVLVLKGISVFGGIDIRNY
ncbi:LiaF transmembrane domain-containing protein [Chitinophagaceae bacterium LWZ2-11]